MIQGNYVSYEVSKLLQEKKYNSPTHEYYLNDGRLYHSEFLMTNQQRSDGNGYSAPCLYEAQRWLRDEHNLNIKVDYDESQLWGWSIQRCNERDDYEDNCSMFNTYEEALNDGIKNALRLINYD